MFEKMRFSVVHRSSQLKSSFNFKIQIIRILPFRILSEISGTAAMIVGFNSDASPLEPFLILEDLSDRVKVEEYPMPIPK